MIGSSVNNLYQFEFVGGKLERINLNPFEGFEVKFIDRDGSEHILPTPAHKGAIVMPTKRFEDLTEAEKRAENKRLFGDIQ